MLDRVIFLSVFALVWASPDQANQSRYYWIPIMPNNAGLSDLYTDVGRAGVADSVWVNGGHNTTRLKSNAARPNHSWCRTATLRN